MATKIPKKYLSWMRKASLRALVEIRHHHWQPTEKIHSRRKDDQQEYL